MTSGRSLELYFVDGKPDGMLTAEVFNWTGHVLRIPRTRLADGLRRDEAGQTGVYLLLGEDADGPLAYIGEAEDMARRLGQHAKEKDWWEVAILVTTTGDALHKAHVKYLESRLISTARAAAAMRLENGNQPSGASLNEAATANMESFLETLHMVLPAIRVDVFQTGRRSAQVQAQTNPERTVLDFKMQLPRVDVAALATLSAGEMIVRSGSRARGSWVGSANHSYAPLYAELLSSGVLQSEGEFAEFVEDYAFRSPSAAASIVAGRAANGRTKWKLPDGRTYADWEAEQISGATE